MKLIYRKTFFWTAVLLFLVAAPLLILNAGGFRYDFQEKSLIQTGTLVLKTQPAGARVWINHEERADKTPAEIAHLLPQRYSVRIEADHFHPWQKEVEVRESEITLKDKILLIPKEIPLSPVTSKAVRTFAVSPDSRHIAYARRESADESVWLVDLDENKEAHLFSLDERTGEPSPAYSIDRLSWSSDNDHIALAVSSPEENLKRYFLIETKSETSPFEIVLPGREDFSEWQWSDDGGSFFFIHQHFLHRADPTKRTIEQVVPEKVTGYTLSGETIYFVSDRPSALFKKELSSEEQTLVYSIRSDDTVGSFRNRERVTLSPDRKMALLNDGEKLGLVALTDDPKARSPIQPIASHAEDARFSEDGRKLLYQTEKGLFVYYLKEASSDWGSKAGITETVVQQRNAAVGPIWYGDQAHVLYGEGDTVFIAEAGEGGKPGIYPLVRTAGESPRFVYNNKTKEALFLVYRDQLYRADLSFEKPASDPAVVRHFSRPNFSLPLAQNGPSERAQENPKERSSGLPLLKARS